MSDRRNCYILQSQQQNPGDTQQSISALTDQRRDQILSDALQRLELSKAQAKSILKQIRRWNRDIACQFKLKQAPFSTSPLRMIQSRWEAIGKDGELSANSFVALSYCWRTPEWHPVADAYQPPTAEESIPISKTLWNFLLGLLESSEEAIWIDQICIDQKDSAEKISAVASMDALYASARLVFVALEDISLTYSEVSNLIDAFKQVAEDHDWILSSESARNVFTIVSKIFRARWFRRAWCFHEYHLAQNRLLAIPCEGAPGGDVDSAIGLVNFAEFIFRLAYFQNEEIREQNSDLIQRMLSFFGGQGYAYSNIISNTFSHNSKYFEDKLTISLNICQISLSFTEAAAASDRSRIYLLIVALAAGDATVLTTRGPKLQYGETLQKTSWLHKPDQTSWNARHPFPLPRGISSLALDHIILDLLFIRKTCFRSCSAQSLASAKQFLSSRLACQIRIAYGLQKKGAEYVEDHGTTETLACAIDCGFLWMVQAWYRIRGEVAAEVELSFDVIQGLAVPCVRKIFCATAQGDCKASRSKSFSSIRFPFSRQAHHLRSKQANEMVKKWITCFKYPRRMRLFVKRAFEMLVCIMLFGKYWEMGTLVTMNKSGDRALCDLHKRKGHFSIPAPSEHKLYSKTESTLHPRADTVLAVPGVIANKKFGLSDRLWLLEQLTDEHGRCWRVRDNVCLLGCASIRPDGKNIVLRREERVVG